MFDRMNEPNTARTELMTSFSTDPSLFYSDFSELHNVFMSFPSELSLGSQFGQHIISRHILISLFYKVSSSTARAAQ